MLVTRRVQGLILIAVDCFLMIVLSFFFFTHRLFIYSF